MKYLSGIIEQETNQLNPNLEFHSLYFSFPGYIAKSNPLNVALNDHQILLLIHSNKFLKMFVFDKEWSRLGTIPYLVN